MPDRDLLSDQRQRDHWLCPRCGTFDGPISYRRCDACEDRPEVRALGYVDAGTPHARMEATWERMHEHEADVVRLTNWTPVSSVKTLEWAYVEAFDRLRAENEALKASRDADEIKAAVGHNPLTCELCHAEGFGAELDALRVENEALKAERAPRCQHCPKPTSADERSFMCEDCASQADEEAQTLRDENERLRAILDGTDDAAIERAARALCASDGTDPDAECDFMAFHAKDALAALRAAGETPLASDEEVNDG